MISLIVIAAILIAYATFSRPLDERGVTSALVLMIAGLLVGTSVLGWLDVPLDVPLTGTRRSSSPSWRSPSCSSATRPA